MSISQAPAHTPIHHLFSQPVRLLAPMEGLTDPLMRKTLSQIAYDLGRPYDWAVSEFIRVTHYPLPAHVFYKAVPELYNAGKTESGTPVHIQLLGNNPDTMSQSAVVAVALGAPAIDLNFGCPAKTVNNHKGGSVLLDEPNTLHTIISAVRKAVPAHIPVSAKIRLGYQDTSKMGEIAAAIKESGANWLTVHARTKVDGYRPPAYWDKITAFSHLGIPIIANGEIWTASDAKRCMALSNTEHLMLGRGAVCRPDLIATIDKENVPALGWEKLVDYQLAFLNDATSNLSGLVGRYKQWLGMLCQGYPEAKALWHTAKKIKHPDELKALIQQSAPTYPAH